MKVKLIYLIVLFTFVSCHSILDKIPLDEITEESYWHTSDDMELFINGLYPVLRGNTGYSNKDNNSDNMQPTSPNDIMNGTRSVPESGGGWGWSDIRKINYFLEKSKSVTEGNLQDIDHYYGEGLFFRAYLYFDKVKRFGNVPSFDKVLNIDSEELFSMRSNRRKIVDNIIDDLDEAINRLKSVNDVGNNRISKEAALLFKSRVTLYEGTWEKYHEGTIFGVENPDYNSYFELAADAALELIEQDELTLFSTGSPSSDYYALFGSDDLTDITEAILVESIDPNQDLGSYSWANLNGIRGHGSGITKSLIDDYLDIHGLPISLSDVYKGDHTLLSVVENRDPRLDQSLWTPGKIQINSNPPQIFKNPPLGEGSSFGSTTGYMVRKGSTIDPSQNTGSSTDAYGKVDGFVFRYAEVLLNYAEAKAELGNLSQEDLDISINKIRDRVGMPALNVNVDYEDPLWAFPNLSPLINEIRRERRVELAFEGYRYDDLMRWRAGKIIKGKRLKGARFIEGVSFPEMEDELKNILLDDEKYIDRYQSILPNGFGFDENRDYLYPIPTNELSLNPNLEQNPGW